MQRLASTVLFFVFIFLTGFWLNRRGSPYSMVLVTIHKLIGLAAGTFLGWTIYQINQSVGLNSVQIIAIAVTALLFAVNVATGSLLSTNKPMPKTVSIINKMFPYLTGVSTIGMLSLLS